MAPRPRKRVRRRRVAENFDESSDSSSPSSSSSTSSPSNHPSPKNTNNKSSSESSESSSESDSADSSSSSSSSSGSSLNRPTAKRGRLAKKQLRAGQQQQQQDGGQGMLSTETLLGRSPSPAAQSPPAPLPSSFFDPDLALPYLDSPPDFSLPAGFETRPATRQIDGLQSARQQLAQDEERFRDWYMTTIVDRFPNELDQLRSSCKPQNAHSNLDLLVAALGSGVDIFDDSITLASSSSTSLVPNQAPSSPKMALDDHHLVLESLDLAAQRNTHLDPSLCPSDHSQPSHQSEDIVMDS